MPIRVDAPVRQMSDAESERVEYQVMRLAYEIHNRQGRLCDESIYQSLLALRCEASGLGPVLREVPVRVTFGGFEKTYYLDALVNDGLVIELKVVSALTGEHESQVINYLLLTGLQHGKLINMRPGRVEGRRVLTRLTPDKRRKLTFIEDDWQPSGKRSRWFKDMMIALLQDWGGFLSIALYQEAIMHFLGGREAVERPVDFVVDGRVVGRQRVRLLDDRTAFAITVAKDKPELYEQHLRRLLRHTNLRAIEWLNMVNHDMTFKTVR